MAKWGAGLPRGSRVARAIAGDACRAPPLRGRALAEPAPSCAAAAWLPLQGAEVISGRTHAEPAPLLPLRPRLLPSWRKAEDVRGTDLERWNSAYTHLVVEESDYPEAALFGGSPDNMKRSPGSAWIDSPRTASTDSYPLGIYHVHTCCPTSSCQHLQPSA
ncbi:uncharacterized protein [Symphalangus syndactylus]|uniref:uncharacterized protein isoform X2 n=1 Tax=Symphalangus syndactylus TaxID=9590 RepID=UPI0030045657